MSMSCEYCHEDRDGYVAPFDKNAHIFLGYPDKLIVRFGKERREDKAFPRWGQSRGSVEQEE